MMKRILMIAASLTVLAGLAGVWVLRQGDAGGGSQVPATSAGDESTAAFFPAGPFQVRAVVDPETPKVGRNRVTVFVRDGAGNPVSGAALNVVAVMPAMGSMPAMYAPAEMTETAPGQYEGEFEPSMGGEWPLTVEINAAGQSGTITFDLATGRKGLRCATCGGSQAESTPGTVHVEPGRRQLIGVTTGRVRRKRLRLTIRAPGRVTYDETRLHDVALKFDGWIGRLHADAVGKAVKKGEALFTVYSPDLLAAQEEFLETRRRIMARGKAHSNNPLLVAARRKLRLWDLSRRQIERLVERGRALEYVPVLSPADGVVIEKTVVAGSAFKAGQRLLRIADLSRVWVEAQVYDYELPLITVGMKAKVVLPELQDREYTARVDYVYPFMEEDTRTARVRVVLDNADGFLRPDMYAHIHLKADLGKRLVVPESAVLYAGQRRIVFLDLGEGRLQPRQIRTGQRSRKWIEVLEGLEEGDTVVTSGNFLIAAESKLKAGVEQW